MAADETTPGFTTQPLPKAGVVDRLRGRLPREAAFVQIRNMLATTPYEQVREDDIAAMLASSKLRPRDVTAELLGIFEHAVLVLATDRELSDADWRGIATLQRAFELTEGEASQAVERAVGLVFQRALRSALEDGSFTADERAMLEATSKALGMSDAQTKQIYESAAVAAVQSAFDLAVADRRYSSTDEERVNVLAASLGVTLKYDESTAALVERFRVLGQVADGHLPVVDVPILLRGGERCHFAAARVAHKEMRTVTKRINYSGPTASVRIMKGVRWRVGSIAVERVSQDVLTPVDTVDVYLTNKKVFLQGVRKNTSIALGKIAHFTVFNDGLQIEKESGKDVYLVGAADWELAGACLDAVTRASR